MGRCSQRQGVAVVTAPAVVVTTPAAVVTAPAAVVTAPAAVVTVPGIAALDSAMAVPPFCTRALAGPCILPADQDSIGCLV